MYRPTEVNYLCFEINSTKNVFSVLPSKTALSNSSCCPVCCEVYTAILNQWQSTLRGEEAPLQPSHYRVRESACPVLVSTDGPDVPAE